MDFKENEESKLMRVDVDRELREYRKLASVLRSAGSYGMTFGDMSAEGASGESGMDDAALYSRMYALRSLVLSVEDVHERLLLYNYYIKGMTLERCAKVLGVSRRTVYRLKANALSSAASLRNK